MAALRVTLSRGALVAAAILVASAPLSAQQYPTKPVKIIVAFAPGGGNDLIARVMAKRLTPPLANNSMAKTRPGPAGTTAFRPGIKSPRMVIR